MRKNRQHHRHTSSCADTEEAVSVHSQRANTVWSLRSTHNPPVNAWFDDEGEQWSAAAKSNRTSIQNIPLWLNEKCQNCIKETDLVCMCVKKITLIKFFNQVPATCQGMPFFYYQYWNKYKLFYIYQCNRYVFKGSKTTPNHINSTELIRWQLLKYAKLVSFSRSLVVFLQHRPTASFSTNGPTICH